MRDDQSRSFLAQLAHNLYQQHGEHLENVCLVFPNKRSGLFFRKHLANLVQQPVWAPEVINLEELFAAHTPLQQADRLSLVFTLYRVYKEVVNAKEDFDQFYFWGDLLINDFNEIDQYEVNATKLFTNIRDIRQIDSLYDYLNDEQRQAIEQFWLTAIPQHQGETTDQREPFLAFWEKLPALYEQFNRELESAKMSYKGMLCRSAITKLEETGEVAARFTGMKLIFAGFNALTPVEKKLINWFRQHKQASVYWDTDAFYMEAESRQEAGMFLREHQKDPRFKDSFPQKHPQHIATGANRKIFVQGMPLDTDQAKRAGELVGRYMQEKGFEVERTAIVLPDENLLLPVLHSLPAELSRINVTMGYPLRNTVLYSLIAHVFELQKTTIEQEGVTHFFHKHILALLYHPYLKDSEGTAELITQIEEGNRAFLAASFFAESNRKLLAIFQPVSATTGLFAYLKNILAFLYDQISETLSTFNEEEETDLSPPMVMEAEFIYQFFTHLNRLESLLQEQAMTMNLPTFMRLFLQIIRQIKIPFTGEPLRGLQIMGMLETRNLDFDHVIILAMNEQVMPPTRPMNSMIPNNLRKGFGLPLSNQSDAVSAYLYYRLMQSAQNIHLLYNTTASGLRNGEPSRFIRQVQFEAYEDNHGRHFFPGPEGFQVIQDQSFTRVERHSQRDIIIEKNEAVQALLNQYLTGKSKKTVRLSPSALATYVRCPLQFYFSQLARIAVPDRVQEEVNPAIFGNLFHRAIELLYLSYQGKTVEKAALDRLKNQIPEAVDQALREHYNLAPGETLPSRGRELVVRQAIETMVKKVIDNDQWYAPFTLLHLEFGQKPPMSIPFSLHNPANEQVMLGGKIDRVDLKDGTLRIIDYKTGQVDASISDINQLFDHNKDKGSALRQALWYSMVYKQTQTPEHKIMPCIAGLNNIKKEGDNFGVSVNRRPITDYREVQDEFEAGLRKVLQELFDVNTPFFPTSDEKRCERCDFNRICNKGR